MGIELVKSEGVRKAIGYLTDPRPAWVWSGDGETLLWQNPAAALFRAKSKRSRLKRAALAQPIKGLVSRTIRLGTTGRASLSRMQFQVGNKPISITCTGTPLPLADGSIGLMIVAVDPIDKDIFSKHGLSADVLADVFENDTDFVLFGADDILLGASSQYETSDISILDEAFCVLPAGPGNARMGFFVQDAPITMDADEDTPDDTPEATTDDTPPTQPLDDALETPDEAQDQLATTAPEGEPQSQEGDADDSANAETTETADDDTGLTGLLDRLAGDDALFTPLGPEDDLPPAISLAHDVDQANREAQADMPLWQVTGTTFSADEVPDETPAENDTEGGTSRYNFEELSRILSDRIGSDRQAAGYMSQGKSAGDTDAKSPNVSGELVNLSDESLVLNRLPLGLLIFRDQEILFANRALVDLVGYATSADLRRDGLASIFPPATAADPNAGPVAHLAHKDGHPVPVAARLQTISWQGRPALLLSARTEPGQLPAELAVRGFAETFAAAENIGFFSANRAGTVETITQRAADFFGENAPDMSGQTVRALVSDDTGQKLQSFLEAPARFAGGERPHITLRGREDDCEIMLFTEGQAGLVTGYFGFVRHDKDPFVARPGEAAQNGVEPVILGRLTRALRRPLNTIIGFAELIRSSAFGPIDNVRYVEYARDIKTSGQGIVSVIDEFEDIIRLHTGEYTLEPHEFDLGKLLDSCISRVRGRAGGARVFVRSAISERLPKVVADANSLSQAMLNLLASAIDQTPEGGQIVISAQNEDDGGVTIHVRDSGNSSGNLAENFVVFRDGTDSNGEPLKPVQSSIGLALTRSLVAVNTCRLDVEATFGSGTLLSLNVPADITIR